MSIVQNNFVRKRCVAKEQNIAVRWGVDNRGMERDMDLIREILEFAEKHCVGSELPGIDVSSLPEKFHGITNDMLGEHIILARAQGLLIANHDSCGWYLERLTPFGHDYLAEVRKPCPPEIPAKPQRENGILKFIWDKIAIPVIVAVLAGLILLLFGLLFG